MKDERRLYFNEEPQWQYSRDGVFAKYACVNGAYHTYSCGPACWNNHPDHKEDTDFRMDGQQ